MSISFTGKLYLFSRKDESSNAGNFGYHFGVMPQSGTKNFSHKKAQKAQNGLMS